MINKANIEKIPQKKKCFWKYSARLELAFLGFPTALRVLLRKNLSPQKKRTEVLLK